MPELKAPSHSMAEYSDSEPEDPNKITDVVSCLNYLKKREVFLYKMMNDPSHKAMLYFLEVLMNADSNMTIAQLADRFSHKTFTPDMREAVGNNEEGLRKFLLRYPSLFRVDGEVVSSVSLGELPPLTSLPPATNGSSGGSQSENSISSNAKHERSANSGGANSGNVGGGSSSINGVVTRRESASYDFGMETEAVKYFQTRLAKREERWVPIKSLAGHLSQASPEIRTVVGPQLEFRKFLLKHTHVFEVQGDLVGLRDPFPSACLSKRPKAHLTGNSVASIGSSGGGGAGSGRINRPKSLLMSGHHGGSGGSAGGGSSAGSMGIHSCGGGLNCGSGSIGNAGLQTAAAIAAAAVATTTMNLSGRRDGGTISAPTTPTAHGVLTGLSNVPGVIGVVGKSVPITMSSNEYKAIMFLRKVIDKKGGAVTLSGLLNHLGHAPEAIRNTIGWTKIEMEEFVRKHLIFFDISGLDQGEVVRSRKAGKVNIIITGSRPGEQGTRTLTNRKGRVFHVAKLWGIIDLGRHEHVFFDKSIFKHVDDLQKHFKVGETLYFNAILAPKESRAKWRATQVWKESDREMVERWSGSALNSRANGHGRNGESGDDDRDCSDLLPADDCGLGLADDIKFLSDELEDELARILQLSNKDGRLGEEDEDDDSIWSIPSPETCTSPDISIHSEPALPCNQQQQQQMQQPQMQQQQMQQSQPHHQSHSHSQPQSTQNSISSSVGRKQAAPLGAPNGLLSAPITGATNRNHTNSNSSSNNTSISETMDMEVLRPLVKVAMRCVSTQTLSTGDIMATQIFHDNMVAP